LVTGLGGPEPYVVVGAGPTAAAAAKALVSAGRRVVVVDTGLSLEPEREAARERMAATAPAMWQPSDLALTSFPDQSEGGFGYKRLFGSDMAFRDDGVLALSAAPEVGARPSYALGGLSNVWGSGLLPYTDRDLAGWPISADELTDGYRAVLDFIPYAGEDDELAARYPLFRAPDGPLLRTFAGEALLARLRRHHGALAAAGYHVGAPRLAVRVGHPAPSNGCVYCGHCLDGCPYGHIYNAAQTFAELRDQRLIEYRSGLHVDRVSERDGEVLIEATAIAGGPGATLSAPRVFLAAGVLSTTIILQRSGLLAQRAEVADSQALYLPFLWLGSTGQTGREPEYTLAQVMIVLDDPAVSANPIHMALYTANDGFSERARAVYPRLSGLLGPALGAITRRLVVGICFFHSEDSDRVASSWAPESDSVRLDPVPSPATGATVRRFQLALARSLGRIGLLPLAPLAQRAPAGGGFHYGATIPMASSPAAGQCDTLGRPHPTRRIHVVDASSFPSVPGGAITFSGMANSHRIVTAAMRDDAAR
jgi:choline dehydrogenase-like flavoprotein